MGIEYSCQTLESEEETINKIFRDMFKKDYQSGIIYKNFLKCLIFNTESKQKKLNIKLFFSLMEIVIEENQYREIYLKYFSNIIIENSEIDRIRKIGLILIDLSLHKEVTKKEFYQEHFFKFYIDIEDKNDNNKKGKIIFLK